MTRKRETKKMKRGKQKKEKEKEKEKRKEEERKHALVTHLIIASVSLKFSLRLPMMARLETSGASGCFCTRCSLASTHSDREQIQTHDREF